MMSKEPKVAEDLRKVRAAIVDAARTAGRDPDRVRLVAVSKLQPVEAIAQALSAGQHDFGENYAQELRDKAQVLPPEVCWHFIGALQRNKVKYVVGVCRLIHTVDSGSLLEEIARRAQTLGIVQRCLIEVNVGGEQQKAGCAPDAVPGLVDMARRMPSLEVAGFMCIPPPLEPEAVRPYFRRLAALASDERRRTGLALAELSMGMSGDFAVAVAEGATLVRIGTAIFGERRLASVLPSGSPKGG